MLPTAGKRTQKIYVHAALMLMKAKEKGSKKKNKCSELEQKCRGENTNPLKCTLLF